LRSVSGKLPKGRYPEIRGVSIIFIFVIFSSIFFRSCFAKPIVPVVFPKKVWYAPHRAIDASSSPVSNETIHSLRETAVFSAHGGSPRPILHWLEMETNPRRFALFPSPDFAS
jgi:hypothetical protein